jgi:hypothetical protein
LIEALMTTPVRHEDGALKPRAYPPATSAAEPIAVGLNAAIFAMREEEPAIAVIEAARSERAGEDILPGGPFLPREHDTLEDGLRFWVKRQTGIDLGAARQLCTIGDRPGRIEGAPSLGPPTIAVCYLALIGPSQCNARNGAIWRSWYAYLPWEDWRQGKPECLTREIEPRLEVWASLTGPHAVTDRTRRLRLLFGFDGAAWDEERVLDRYDLLCEAGLIGATAPADPAFHFARLPPLQHPVLGNHARLLASAIGEVRRSIKWQPAIFELMGDVFTLFELQKTVEAILGPHLHKQNFRRLVEAGGLVEPTGGHRFRTGGRPARLYRFRRDVLLERLAQGVRVKAGRA